jgi:hypothetical protein
MPVYYPSQVYPYAYALLQYGTDQGANFFMSFIYSDSECSQGPLPLSDAFVLIHSELLVGRNYEAGCRPAIADATGGTSFHSMSLSFSNALSASNLPPLPSSNKYLVANLYGLDICEPKYIVGTISLVIGVCAILPKGAAILLPPPATIVTNRRGVYFYYIDDQYLFRLFGDGVCQNPLAAQTIDALPSCQLLSLPADTLYSALAYSFVVDRPPSSPASPSSSNLGLIIGVSVAGSVAFIAIAGAAAFAGYQHYYSKVASSPPVASSFPDPQQAPSAGHYNKVGPEMHNSDHVREFVPYYTVA